MKQFKSSLKGSTQKFIELGELREDYISLLPLEER